MTPYEMGIKARRMGNTLADNPYVGVLPLIITRKHNWDRGWVLEDQRIKHEPTSVPEQGDAQQSKETETSK